jgi:predicted DNA-binding protein
MIVIAITNEQRARAKELYSFDKLNGSFTEGKGNNYGAIGEIIVFDYYKNKGFDVNNKIVGQDIYNYDLIINEFKVEIKTKSTTVYPQGHFLCSISSHNINQMCDFYFFVRVLENLQTGFLLGYKSKNDFFKNAKFDKKGSPDISGNGWIFKEDCYNLPVKDLDKFKK